MVNNASVRSIRIIHIFFLAATVGYMFLAETLPRPAFDLKPVFVDSFAILSLIDVAIAFVFRRKLLPPAIDKLRRDPSDASALGRWRAANMLSLVLAMSVALYGFALRFLGGSRLVAWPFFVASLALMLLWRPRLDEGANSTQASPPEPR